MFFFQQATKKSNIIETLYSQRFDHKFNSIEIINKDLDIEDRDYSDKLCKNIGELVALRLALLREGYPVPVTDGEPVRFRFTKGLFDLCIKNYEKRDLLLKQMNESVTEWRAK
jgi:hypothetical protein